MTNRVEDLEEEISELQAQVNGLLSELTDTKERVRELEQQLDEYETTEESPTLNSDTGQIEVADENTDQTNDSGSDSDDSDDPDVIIA